MKMGTLFEATKLDAVEQPDPFTPPPVVEPPFITDELPYVPVSPSVRTAMELVQNRIYEAFGSKSNMIDAYSGTGKEVLELHDDDSQATIDGPTDKKNDSDADMVGLTDKNNGSCPRPEHHKVGVSDMPYDPPWTQ